MVLRPRNKALILLGIVVAGAAGTVAWAGADLWHPHALHVRLASTFAALGPWAPIAYVALFCIAPFLLLPMIPMSLAAGALFGPAWGAVWNLAGATAGAGISFLVGRAMGHDFVAKRAHGKLLSLKSGVEREGWRFVAFLRLVPILPFGPANILLGATDIRFGTYLLASTLAMAPGAAIYAYVGWAGRSAAAGMDGLTTHIGIAVGLLLLLSGVPAAVRYARRKRVEDAV